MGDEVKSLIEATSGAFGGLLSTAILYPLDTCKTKYQAESNSAANRKYKSSWDVFWEALRENQVSSLYRGLCTKSLQAVITGFVYFYSYNYVKQRYLVMKNLKTMGTGANLLVAATAGACTAIATQPLDSLSGRLQTSSLEQKRSALFMLIDGGLDKALNGLGVSLLLTCNPAIQYTVFEQLRNRLLTQRSKALKQVQSSPSVALSALQAFLLGALAKSIATLITYPLIRCKVLIQREEAEAEKQLQNGSVSRKSSKSVLQAMQLIWKNEGLSGFYRGLQAQIFKTVLGAALMLMIKEKVSQGSRMTVLALRNVLLKSQTKLGKSKSANVRRKNSKSAVLVEQLKNSFSNRIIPVPSGSVAIAL